MGAMVASVLLYLRFYQSTFYQKSASIECFYFAFCFVHSGNTSSTSTLPQADMLSISNDRTELANSRQMLSKVEKDWVNFHLQIDRQGEHRPTGDAGTDACYNPDGSFWLNLYVIFQKNTVLIWTNFDLIFMFTRENWLQYLCLYNRS